MLHRRQTGSTSIAAAPPPATSTPLRSHQQQEAPNQTFKPLRRESGSLYSPPTPAGPTSTSNPGGKARYSLPSSSPAINGYGGPGTSSYFPSTGFGAPSAYSSLNQANQATSYGHMSSSASEYPRSSYDQNAGARYQAGVGGGLYDLSERVYEQSKKDEIIASVRSALDRFVRGLRDAARLDRSWAMVREDTELRNLVLRSTLINLVSLMLLSFSPNSLVPCAVVVARCAEQSEECGHVVQCIVVLACVCILLLDQCECELLVPSACFNSVLRARLIGPAGILGTSNLKASSNSASPSVRLRLSQSIKLAVNVS